MNKMKPTKLELCINAALAGGKVAQNAGITKANKKTDGFIGGNQEIKTGADILAQQAILEYLDSKDPNAYFLTEEKVDNEKLAEKTIKEENLNLLNNKGVYIIDPICGSASHNTGHWEWATGVAYMKNLTIEAGASFLPTLNGGTLYFGSLGEGAFTRNGICFKPGEVEQIKVDSRKVTESYVIFGNDCLLREKYPIHTKLLPEIAPELRATNLATSCVMPLAALADGCFQAFVQPLQSPWDYASGSIILNEAGGIMQFYEMDDKGNPTKKIDSLDINHYNPNKKGIAFIAGADRRIVDFITEKLFSKII